MANAYAPTYPELVLEIQDITENSNSEFVSNIPRFVARAQDQVQRDLGLDMWRTYLVDNLTTMSFDRDEDWLIVRSIYLPATNKYLLKRHLDWVRAYGGSSGVPKYWCEDEEDTILVAPTPSASTQARFEVMERLAALSVSNPTNWITRNAADLLLLQCLMNAFEYEVSPERSGMMMQAYQAALPAAMHELRDSERVRDQPIRAAPRPSVQAGANA